MMEARALWKLSRALEQTVEILKAKVGESLSNRPQYLTTLTPKGSKGPNNGHQRISFGESSWPH